MTGSFGRRQKGSGALSISGPLNFIPDLLLSPAGGHRVEVCYSSFPKPVRSAPNHCASFPVFQWRAEDASF
jgi:hypothetical protein